MDLLKHQYAAIRWINSCVTNEHFSMMNDIIAKQFTPDTFRKSDPEDVYHAKFKLYFAMEDRRTFVKVNRHKLNLTPVKK